jgi:hypothetical protein
MFLQNYLIICTSFKYLPLAGKAFTFFPVKKSKQKRPVQKKAIAKHRAFPSQNAFSIALIIFSLILIFYKGDRRTFPAHPLAVHYVKGFAFGALHFTSFLFTIACFLNDIPDQ